MKTSYLIKWQLGDNEQSIKTCAVDVEIKESDTAEDKYIRILDELIKEENMDESIVNILAVYKL